MIDLALLAFVSSFIGAACALSLAEMIRNARELRRLRRRLERIRQEREAL